MNLNCVEGLSEDDILYIYDNILDDKPELATCECHTNVWSNSCKCRDTSGFNVCWNNTITNSSRCNYYCTSVCKSSNCYSYYNNYIENSNFCSSI